MEEERPDIQDIEEESREPESTDLSAEETASRLDELEQQKELLTDRLKRVQADFSNYRKRMEDEKADLQQQANARLIGRLLPIIDGFRLAMNHGRPSEADPSWMEGIDLIYRQLLSLLESEGVTLIEALGDRFDPFEHEALAYQESGDKPEGTIIDVIQTGYKLHGRILRPARVIVAKGVTTSQDSEENENA